VPPIDRHDRTSRWGWHATRAKSAKAGGAKPTGLPRDRGGHLGFTYMAAIKGFSAQLPHHAIATLQRNPLIVRIEPDRIAHGTVIRTNPGSWGLDRIDQRALPLNAAYSYSNAGEGVSVYILRHGGPPHSHRV